MIDTLHAILTDADIRQASAVEARLSQEASAGTPWYNEA